MYFTVVARHRHLQPRVLQQLLDVHSPFRILHEQVLDEVLCIGAHRLPYWQLELQGFLQSHADRLNRGGMIEGEAPAQEGVHDAPNAPDVTGETIVLLFEHLRAHIT